jgi:urease accessory protein
MGMRLLRKVPFIVAALLLSPSIAEAHLVTTGLGPFYDGAMHLALSPEDLLGLFAAALLAGLRGPQVGRWTLALLPLAWLVAAMMGLMLPGLPALPGLSILSFVFLGLLVALDVTLPAWGVLTLTGLFGLLHGLLNGVALFEANAGVLNVLGIVTTVFIVFLLVTAAVVSLKPAWTRVAVRVAGSWVVAVGMLMFGWLFRGSVALAVVISLVLINSASACFVCRVPYQSLLDKVEGSELVIVARPVDQAQTRWQIVRVLKANDNFDLNQLVTNVDSGQNTSGESQLLRRAAVTDAWTNEGVVDQELLGFLTGAIELLSKSPQSKPDEGKSPSLRFFLPYLEHTNQRIADSAFHKLLNAPYKDVRKLGKDLKPQELLELIENPQLPTKRRSLYITLLGFCGGQRESTLFKQWIDERWKNKQSGDLAVILAAHVELNGEATVQFIEQSYLQNRDRKLDEIIEAVAALRMHGEADGKIPRARIQASYHLFLKERPPLLEIIIEDCARWKDWSIAPQLIEIYAGGQQPWNNAMIMKYMRACPLPEAKRFVKAEAARDNRNSGDVSAAGNEVAR